MFGQLFKYGFKSLVRVKEIMIWTSIFPFALCMFMYLAFSGIFDATEKFSKIPVAVVGQSETYDMMFDAVTTGEQPLLVVTKASEDEAEKLLQEEKVKGVIRVGDSLKLEVLESGQNETLLKLILEQFEQYKVTIENVAKTNPDVMMNAVEELTQNTEYVITKSTSEGNQDNVVNYFYAIFSMLCMFASYTGCDRVVKLQANMSDLGQRRNLVPVHKLKLIVADFLVCESLQYSISIVLLVFMKYVLKIDLGDKIPAMLLLLFVGTSYGILLGMAVGSIGKFSAGAKTGILTIVSLLLCCLSDLMAPGIKNLLEHHFPIANRINPATLISDSFYALNVYDTYDRFIRNISLLGAGCCILLVISFIMVRRTRYASI